MNNLLVLGLVLMAIGAVPAVHLTVMSARGKYTGKLSDMAGALVSDNLALVFYCALMVILKEGDPIFYVAAVIAGAAGAVMYLILLHMVRGSMPKPERRIMLLSLAECCGVAVLAIA